MIKKLKNVFFVGKPRLELGLFAPKANVLTITPFPNESPTSVGLIKLI